MTKAILIILGSGLYDLYSGELSSPKRVRNQFGSAVVQRVTSDPWKDSQIFVMMRHGPKHSIPPHLINYRANITAAKQLKVDYIVATSSVGSLRRKLPIGSYVVIDQFIDFTRNRPSSIYYDRSEKFAHTDMSHPFSEIVRKAILIALRNQRKDISFSKRGTYVCTEGPRFETPAEIRMFQTLGTDVVGMTCVPEVIIANELGIPYGNLCHVTNMAAGMQKMVTQDEVNRELGRSLLITKEILDRTIKELARAD